MISASGLALGIKISPPLSTAHRKGGKGVFKYNCSNPRNLIYA
jgi:hypothetical protein